MSRVLAARAATRSCTAGSASGHHEGPELFDGGAAGGAGGDQIIAGRGGIVQKFQVEAHQVPEGLGVAAGQGRNAAAALAGGEIDPHPVVLQDLEHRVGHLGIELVDEAAHEKGHLEAGGPGSGVPPGDLAVPGDRRQGLEVPVGQQRRHEPGAGGAQEVVHRLDENPLEFGAPGQDAVEPVRLAQEPPEDGFFHRGQPQVARQDGPGLDEDIQHLDAAGTVGGAGAAQQAAAQMILDPLGVGENFLGQAGQEGQLAPGHVGLPPGFGEQGAHRLAQAAAHAAHQLVFQFLHEPGQLLEAGHGYFPKSLSGQLSAKWC